MKTMAPSSVATRTTPNKAAAQESKPAASMAAWWVTVLGWLFPGMGYFLHQKWIRGGLVFVCVLGMFGVGLSLHGHIYPFNTDDVLSMLGFVGDLCAGVLYFLTRGLGAGGGNPSNIMGDYGTVFLISAGLLNLLAASDARDVFLGRKQ